MIFWMHMQSPVTFGELVISGHRKRESTLMGPGGRVSLQPFWNRFPFPILPED